MIRIHLRRSAFTLIELLVVIAIIAILAALLMGGVMALLRQGPAALNRNDLLQLNTNLQRFYEKHKFYPPDRIRLCSNRTQYGSSALDQLSLQAIGTIWPNTNLTNVNWSGNLGAGPYKDDFILEGDQCLVFFLGGMPNGNNQAPQGFFNNPANPTVAAGISTDRVKWHEFESARCELLRPGNPFPSYLDAHYKDIRPKLRPYIYFSAGRRPNGYSATNTLFNVAPYVQQAGTPTKYYNPTSYQLISAGADGEFGLGGAWTPGGGNQASKDDISNFHGGTLGSQ